MGVKTGNQLQSLNTAVVTTRQLDIKAVLVQGATIASKPSQIKVWEAQTPRKIRVLIENELYSY